MLNNQKDAQVKLTQGPIDTMVLQTLKNENRRKSSSKPHFVVGAKMRLKRLSSKRLKRLENKLKSEIAIAEENIAAEKNRLEGLRNNAGQVRARLRQLDCSGRYIHKEKIRNEFLNLKIASL